MIKPDKAYTIKKMLEKCCEKYAERTAYEADFGRFSMTFGQLWDTTKRLVGYMYDHGFYKKNVALIGKNSTEYTRILFAALTSNISLVPIDPSLPLKEMAERISFADAEFIICDDRNIADSLKKECPQSTAYDMKELMEAAENSESFDLENEVIEDDHVSLMIFSSGTGGRMKLVMLTQIGLFTEWYVVKDYDEVMDRGFIVAPLFHILGISDAIGNWYMGKSMYISQGFAFQLKELEYARPKCIRMVPATAQWLYQLIKDKPKEEGRALLGGNLRNIRTSGAALEVRLVDEFAKYAISVVSDYGMTEVGGPVSVAVPKGDILLIQKGTVGKCIDGLDVVIEKIEGCDYGEILLGGNAVFKGYYKDPEATGECLINGFYHTGDLGMIDDEGFLHIVGRSKNVIILSNGENIIPEQMEKELYTCTYIRECLVYADNDVLSVKIVPSENNDETKENISSFIKNFNRNNPVHKQIGKFLFVDELTRTSTGKMKR